jgi:simple sugar transport system ATP-binding protein
VPELPVGENLTLTVVDEFGPLGFIIPRRRRERAQALVSDLEVVTTGVEQKARDLSGGNQQKVVIGRALASTPKLLVLLGPTQGVDIAAKDAIFQIITSARARGGSALLVSDEVEELAICDRIYVVFRGEVVAKFTGKTDSNVLIHAIEGIGLERRKEAS